MLRLLKILLAIICIVLSVEAFSANEFSVRIKWKDVQKNVISSSVQHSFISFEGAQYQFDKSELPVFYKRVSVLPNQSPFWQIGKPIYIDLTPEEEKLIQQEWVSDQIEVSSNIGYDRGKPFALVSFIPIRKKKNSVKHEKLFSFKLILSTTLSNHPEKKSILKNFASSSVLSDGQWYRVGISKDGVYKMDYNFLNDLGINMTSVNPKMIKVFGNGGGMLPKRNSDPRVDDLKENAIFIKGENDGVFDMDDYILFYGQGAHNEVYDNVSQQYVHINNIYSDSAYYFISIGSSVGKRIESVQNSLLPVTHIVASFDDVIVHELNEINLLKSGSEWLGENFEEITDYNFQYNISNPDTTLPSSAKMRYVARSQAPSAFETSINGVVLKNTVIPKVDPNYYTAYVKSGTTSFDFTPASSLDLGIHYNQTTSSSVGWLDYFELNVRRYLIMDEDQMPFKDKYSFGSGNIAQFTIGNFNNTTRVWDVSDPTNVKERNGSLVNSDFTFIAAADSLKDYLAFRSKNFLVPTAIGGVSNQNLHGLPNYEMIIVSYPDFIAEAERLAQFHRDQDDLTIHVVTPQQIYNEFSSGAQDVVAIRDFVRMFYERSGNTLPLYLLLFGDGSYDNKNRIAGNNNLIPAYESPESFVPTTSYVSDDYYAFLDSNEGVWNSSDPDYLDVGVGRIPVNNLSDATNVVNKIINYANVDAMGNWRNMICISGDDEDGNVHLNQAETLAQLIADSNKVYNVDKIYLDAYQQVSTGAGEMYPDANLAINNRVDKGALFVNYTGHGGELGWTEEGFVQTSDINGWSNANNLPLFVTATCEFSRWDDPGRTSAGEYILLNPNGGGIALLSTVRLVFSSPNFILNKFFFGHVFEKVDGKYHRFGDLVRLAKNDMSPGVNHRNFALIGDPAVSLPYPKYNVVTSMFNGNTVGVSDTIRAQSTVRIEGYVADELGKKVSNYNGIIYPTFYDKVSQLTTLANDPDPGQSIKKKFDVQNSILYQGKASVKDGSFSFSFVVPKTIAFKYGNAKMSYYSTDGVSDGAGYHPDFIVGGTDTTVTSDDLGPEIEMYLDNERFRSGDMVVKSPTLYANLFDSVGINVGFGIGHDITAIIDGDESNLIVLNANYESDLDSYQKGKVSYKLPDMEYGNHTILFKVWDINENPSEKEIDFSVVSSEDFEISRVLNYPNPFTTHTAFFFEHNRPESILDVEVQIFTLSGMLVRSLISVEKAAGIGIDGVEWDGLNNYGEKIGKGVYVYRIKVRSEDGSVVDHYEKLVVLN